MTPAAVLTEHPFAPFIRILGKGRQGSRSLSAEEAEAAMYQVLTGQAESIQVGAFLMLMRIKEETGEELAAFVRAARRTLDTPAGTRPGLDWPSYAGKRRQLPWFVLSALLVAQHGIPVCLHGTAGFDPQRVFVPQALAALGISEASSLSDAQARLESQRFAFIRLANISPALENMLQLRALLGLRSPVHSLLRMLNPLNASASLTGIFHPGYRDIHQEAAEQLDLQRFTVFKGEGGEAERTPDGPTLIKSVIAHKATEAQWPALLDKRALKDETMDVRRLLAVWRGEVNDAYGEAAIVGTAGVALWTAGAAASPEAADALAQTLWAQRSVTLPR